MIRRTTADGGTAPAGFSGAAHGAEFYPPVKRILRVVRSRSDQVLREAAADRLNLSGDRRLAGDDQLLDPLRAAGRQPHVVIDGAGPAGMPDDGRDMYRWCHLIENFLAKLKEFRAAATRYDKTDDSFRADIHVAAAIIATRQLSTNPNPLLRQSHNSKTSMF